MAGRPRSTPARRGSARGRAPASKGAGRAAGAKKKPPPRPTTQPRKGAPTRKAATARKSPPSRRAAPGAARPSSETRRAANARLQRAAAGDRPYIVGLLVLIILLGGMAAGPLKSFTLGADRVDTLAASRDQLRAEVDRLEERRVRLEDPEELEIIAREQLNLVKPGEVPFIVVTPEAEFERAEPGQGAGPGEVPLWRRLADSLAGLFG